MKIAILSDIHGNLNALNTVLKKIEEIKPDAVALLGDLIDYGMRSNEVIERLKSLPYPLVCNLRGNHENAIIKNDYARFSSERGRICAMHTRSLLKAVTWDYLNNVMSNSGICEFTIGDKLILAVHGSLQDKFWKSISIDSDLCGYEKYNYVFSGHSHLPHYFEKYYSVDNPSTRDKKKTVFINPGSVGQPRNLNNKAQFAVLDIQTEEIKFEKIDYDVADEQSYFDGAVDEFYKTRIKDGI